VPLEAIFDQTFGSVCVGRTGGQVLDRALVGSVEFAVETLGVQLVMVLGHERCGAVAAAVDALRAGRRPPGGLGYLVDEIAPAVLAAGTHAPDAYERALRLHVAATVTRLAGNAVVAAAVDAGRLAVVGAVYDLDTGRVAPLRSRAAVRYLALEDARVDEPLLGRVPLVLRVVRGQRGELGADLRPVAGADEHADLLDERLGVRTKPGGLAVCQVPHVGVLAAVERDDVLELTEHAERARQTGLAGPDGGASGLGGVARHGDTPWGTCGDWGGRTPRKTLPHRVRGWPVG
jgi:carbonic anhydrase